MAFYAGAEADVMSNWTVGIAGRYEHYNTFGTATVGKINTRYEFIPGFALRATVGTGFHAPSPGQNNAQVQLDGLNAGPGSLWPVGQGAGLQDGTLRMENVSPPGSNAVINGAMYGQPVSTLPAQEWMMQQQQKIQQLNSQQKPPDQNGQGYSDQGYRNRQYSGNSPTDLKFGMPLESSATNGNTTAPRPGNPASPVNPLAAYENQLRQLDNQYNNTLQQLDRNASATVPRAQY